MGVLRGRWHRFGVVAEKTRYSRLSAMSLMISTWSDTGAALATATGFVVQRDDGYYLITNAHVLSGRNSRRYEQSLHSSGAVPAAIRVWQVLDTGSDQGVWWKEMTEPVVDADGRPLWFTHPDHFERVDVAALHLTSLEGCFMAPYRMPDPEAALQTFVTNQVSIVGFPLGYSGGGRFAIWAQGAIASEPAIDYEDLPCFLIDSRTRPGQSGAPVIYYSPPGNVPIPAGIAFASAEQYELLGVYSGRIHNDSDIGIVWRPECITAVLDGGVRGRSI
jgi:hypothetical protein